MDRKQIVEASRKGANLAARPSVRIKPHAGIDSERGSFEVVWQEGPTFFYWDDNKGRRLRPDAMDQEQALEAARTFARSVNTPD